MSLQKDDVELMCETITTNCTKVVLNVDSRLFEIVSTDILEPRIVHTNVFYTDDWYGVIQDDAAIIKSFDVNDKGKAIACFKFDFITRDWGLIVVDISGESTGDGGHCDCPEVVILLDEKRIKERLLYSCEVKDVIIYYKAERKLKEAMNRSSDYADQKGLTLLTQDDCLLEAFSGKLQVVDGVPYFPDLDTVLTSGNNFLAEHGWTSEVTEGELILTAVGADYFTHDKFYHAVLRLI